MVNLCMHWCDLPYCNGGSYLFIHECWQYFVALNFGDMAPDLYLIQAVLDFPSKEAEHGNRTCTTLRPRHSGPKSEPEAATPHGIIGSKQQICHTKAPQADLPQFSELRSRPEKQRHSGVTLCARGKWENQGCIEQ